LSELEAVSGINSDELKVENCHQSAELFGSTLSPEQAFLYRRLLRLGEHLLSLMEEFYRRFYHRTLPKISEDKIHLEQQSLTTANELLAVRLQAMLNVALQVAEEYFHLTPKGNFIDRCRRLEQAGWNYIYREDLKDFKALSALERGLADRIAEEANLRMWHMRLVETFVAVTGHYVLEKQTVERFAETTLLLWDMVTRIKGSNPFSRPRLGKQRVQMTVGQPLSVSERYPTYHVSRQGARKAVADLTQDLQNSLAGLISACYGGLR
jgi:hypothetical protein